MSYAKQRDYKVKDSNMAFYGSAAHKKVRKMAADTEVNWKGPPPAGSACELRIWRVENNQGGKCPFGIRPWPTKDYGKFFDGDSYIVLKTFKKARSKKLCHDVFFWLGLESSIGTLHSHTTYSIIHNDTLIYTDEKGVAAYKTVELDDFLGGAAKQHRLVQGNESERFLRCFKAPPVIMHGGIASGFKKVKINANKTSAGGKDPILRQVRKRGRRYVRNLCSISSCSLTNSLAHSSYYVYLQHNAQTTDRLCRGRCSIFSERTRRVYSRRWQRVVSV